MVITCIYTQRLNCFWRLNSHMLKSCICGSLDQEDEEPCSSRPVSTRIKPTRKNKNPYSSRGLDKFSELLSDLDGKRQKIYSQLGSHDISLVRFTFTSSNDCVPIVIKLRRKKGQQSKSCDVTTHHSGELDKDIKTPVHQVIAKEMKMEDDHKTTGTRSKLSWNRKLMNKLRRPSCYVPVALMLILLLLTVCGRSAAAIFISLAWYVVPLLEDSSYSKGLSEKKMSTNISFQKHDHSGASKQNSPRKLQHQKSW